jgi:hypothetical protein
MWNGVLLAPFQCRVLKAISETEISFFIRVCAEELHWSWLPIQADECGAYHILKKLRIEITEEISSLQ